MSRILPLPPEAISQIHSSKQITNLQGVVLALLENSLDAGATKVAITVNFRRGDCTIEDNGCGVPTTEFYDGGGLGRMYHSSKHGNANTADVHGTTGTYLASLAALSLLSITSRLARHAQLATLTIHHGKVIARQIPASSGDDLAQADSRGTRVTVRDLFGNMPVRVKQRALAGSASTVDEKALQDLKRGIVALLLSWPKPCAVKVSSTDDGNRVLTLSAAHPSVSTALTERSLNQLGGAATVFDIRDTLSLVFQAGLAPAGSRQSWVPVSTSTPSIAIKGAICLEPAPTKQCQFTNIGIHPCSSTSGHNELYDAINKVFANSSFGATEDIVNFDEAEKDRRKRDRRYKSDGFTQKQLHGRKGVDRWPMFVLQVKFRNQRELRAWVDSPSDASLKAIIDVLEATVTQWLAANHFRPQKRRRQKNEEQQGPAVASSSPARATSAALSSSNPPQLARFATPSLKRPATTSSATTSRKRKILDISGRPASCDADPVQHSPSAYFNGLSRIKSGRSAFYDDLWEAKKPATAPAGQLGSMQSPLHTFAKVAFKLPMLEAGELGRSRQVAALETRDAIAALSAPSERVEAHGSALPSSDDFGSVDDAAMLTAAESVEKEPSTADADRSAQVGVPDSLIDWMDPVTKQVFQINARTGVVLPVRPKSTQTIHDDSATASDRLDSRTGAAAINTSVSSAGKALSLARRFTTHADSTANTWLPGFLKDWSNPVFARQDEERIPVASFDGPGTDIIEPCGRRCNDHTLTQHFAEAGTSGTSKLSKAALKNVTVIKQVDCKFILCKMPSTDSREDGSTLVLVDQHAASERVLLEDLFAELCAPIDETAPAAILTSSLGYKSGINTTAIERPQRFQVSATESELFTKYAAHFARWGILYDLSQRAFAVTESQVRQPEDEHTLSVRTLPPGIAERCTLFPNVLIELLRSEVWAVESKPATRASERDAETDHDGEHSWLKRIGTCPKGIIDLLNSRACRSAIMFNDALSVEQCKELLARLSRCAFPFMCAHGRISMVPLVELGKDGDGGGTDALGFATDVLQKRDGVQEAFGSSFRRWRNVVR